MKDLEIDNYLAEMVVAIDDLGGRVNLVGLCQGGWVSAMIAARFPDKVNSLVLAGAPIDTDAGNGPIKRMVHEIADFLLRGAGGARRRPDEGQVHAAGLEEHASRAALHQDHVDLYEHIDDPAYLAKEETFESWYENPIDLPGRWYLQAIMQLFKENRLAKGEFVGLGRKLNSARHHLPGLSAGRRRRRHHDAGAGARRRELSRDAEGDRIVQKTVPGGHIGLFMGARTLKEHWPPIARWIAAR